MNHNHQTQGVAPPSPMEGDAPEKTSASNERTADPGLSRRELLRGSLIAAALATGSLGAALPRAEASEVGPIGDTARRNRAYRIRVQTAQFQLQPPFPPYPQPSNGDEDLYPSYVGNFTKGLPHNALGEADPAAYQQLRQALSSGNQTDFEAIPLGGTRKLVNPQAGLAYDLQGDDGHRLVMPPAPSISSAEQAGELVENYWMALLRDVPFAEYETDPLAAAAAADLSALSAFSGPRSGGQVTPATLFRGLTPGDLTGPYVSQFLLRPVPYGTQSLDQRQRPPLAGIEYMTDYAEWLSIQNGSAPGEPFRREDARRYIVDVRDLLERSHIDVLLLAYLNACQILLTAPSADPLLSGIGAPLNGNPYRRSTNQVGFITFGIPYINQLVVEVTTRALKAMWFQKWFVHRRARPEAYAGLVHHRMMGTADYPIHDDVLASGAATEVFSRFGGYLLPMGYPEGSPLHPSYGAGHAVSGGACITVLKAFFDERFVIPDPMVPDPSDPSALIPYQGPPLTVGGELNKLASNIALGRNMGGIHYRSDASQALLLGESIAISVLRDQRGLYNERFAGFTFTRLDGTTITV